jgi:type II secretory pathway component GspD/PulD (secretin)
MRCTVAVLAVALGCLRAGAQEAVEEVTITLSKDQTVGAFLDAVAPAVGRPILYDRQGQRIVQQLGVDVTRTVPKTKALDLVRAILAFYEITLIPVGPKGCEIFLAVDSRSTNNLVKNKAEFVPHDSLLQYEDKEGLYIMTSIPVRHIENLTMLRTALSTLVTPAGIGRVHEVPGSKRLILMDFAPTVVAMARVVREMDVDPETVRTETIVLAHAEAGALAATLKELFAADPPKGPQPPGVLASPAPRIAAYEPLNAVVVLATEGDLARIREVVKQLDVKPAAE